jgi:putative FmdB family regulatory protein
MPLYEYRCESCDRIFEVMQKFSDAPLASCDICGAPVERLLSAPALQFKGSGWYITDYARAGQKEGKSNGAASDTNGKGESKADSKAESKTEAKAESKS